MQDFGVYCDMFSAKSGIEGQDGGVVTALLVKGFRKACLMQPSLSAA